MSNNTTTPLTAASGPSLVSPAPYGPGAQWKQDLLYLAASAWTPGVVYEYVHTPQGNPHEGFENDVTSFHPGQWNWGPPNTGNIFTQHPPILDRILPSQSYHDVAMKARVGCKRFLPAFLVDGAGQKVPEQWPKPNRAGVTKTNFLRYIPVLPEQISTHVEAWRIEAWIRHDPRIRRGDIIDRMMLNEYTPTEKGLNTSTYRWREENEVLCWRQGPATQAVAEVAAKTAKWMTWKSDQERASNLEAPGRVWPAFNSNHGGLKSRNRARLVREGRFAYPDSFAAEDNAAFAAFCAGR